MLKPLHFSLDFVAHLQRLGIGMVPDGAFMVDEETTLEPPLNLYGVNIWGAPARIGAFTYFGANGTFGNAEIGRYCLVADGVQVGCGRHPHEYLTTSPLTYLDFLHFESFFSERDPNWSRRLAPAAPYDIRPRTCIGHDVWIGTSVFIKDGVRVGNGAILGAHAVITHDVPNFAIMAGVPARVIRYRFPESIIARLQALGWWRYNLFLLPLDPRDVPSSLSRLEDAVASGSLAPYAPDSISLCEEHQQFTRHTSIEQALG